MPIRDAIIRATSQHHVYFLVAAYFENMQFRYPPGISPFHLTDLPIRGIADLQRRCDVARAVLVMLLAESDTASCALLSEYDDILTLALERLSALDESTMMSAA